MVKDFINAITNAYKEIYAEKLLAKKKINEIKDTLSIIKDVIKKIDNIEQDFNTVYHYCPIDERCDFVQKTLDLLKYGTRTTKGIKLRSIYSNLEAILKRKLVKCKEYYKSNQYKDAIECANDTLEFINEYYIQHNIIKEKTNS